MSKIIKPGERVTVSGTYRTYAGTLAARAYDGFTGTFTVTLDGEDAPSIVVGTVRREGTA